MLADQGKQVRGTYSRSGGVDAAKQLVERNRATIERLANQFSGGTYAASRAPRPEPRPEGLIIHALGGPPVVEAASPYVRISPNDRVVVADHASGRQLQFLGQIRYENGARRFVLATRANGFFSPLEDDVAHELAGLDGLALSRDYNDDRLAADIAHCLGIGQP